jgi:hypothetical protein
VGGRAGTGVVAGGAGLAGNGGMHAAGAGGSTTGVPFTWNCVVSAYNDGVCDCGCATPDPDCTKNGIDQCERCNADGSCNGADCPGRIDPDNTSRCLAPPSGWTCTWRYYDDGTTCDCGCGIADPDCADAKASSCERCTDIGACSGGPCPSSIDANDNTKCNIPPGWACGSYDYGDGTCDCGCGTVDVDCKSANASDCEFCPSSSCAPYSCTDSIMTDNNAQCSKAPPSWTCPARLYNDGAVCDCGCGFPDPDCGSGGIDACNRCDDTYSCSAQACPGLIDPNDTAHCTHPAPPAGWTCPDYTYADMNCDCGCGVADPDCRTSSIDECLRCPVCGYYQCQDRIDPTNTKNCKPPPAGWTCSAYRYGDGTCDCGCGIMDTDCPTEGTFTCYSCPDEGCAAGNCRRLKSGDPTQCVFDIPSAWKCDRSFYGDGSICDCGCGVQDRDCATTDRGACVACNDTGSCSTAKCPGTILATDNTSCAGSAAPSP